MKKILFIAPIDTHGRFKGGITSYSETIINSKKLFFKNGIEFIPLNNCVVNRESGTNGKFSLKNILNFVATKKNISKKYNEEKYDAIYLNTSYGISLLKDLLTLKRKYKKQGKVFLHIHFAGIENILTKNKIIKHLIIKQLKAKVTNIISLSTKLKEELSDLGFDKENINVLYNYFDPNMPDISKDFIKNKSSLFSDENKKVIFLFLGSLEKRKGFYDLIEVFKQIENKNAKLIICGTPNDVNAESALNNIKNNPSFEYRGYVSGEEKYEIFMNSHIFVLPSYGEGLPISILEALHFGLPIISTAVGSIPEIIHKEIGTVIQPGDKIELSAAIDKYVSQRKNMSVMFNNCLKESSKYTFDMFSKNLIAIIKDFLY